MCRETVLVHPNVLLCMCYPRVCVFFRVFTCLIAAREPVCGIAVQLHSDSHVVMIPSPTLNLLWSRNLSIFYLAEPSLKAMGRVCESPQQRRYTLESPRQREASPCGYSRWNTHLCSPTHFLLYFPPLFSSASPVNLLSLNG